MGATPKARAIRTVYDALAWGDEWVSAYAALQSHAEQLEHQVFMLQVRSAVLEAEALLLQYDVFKALGKIPEAA